MANDERFGESAPLDEDVRPEKVLDPDAWKTRVNPYGQTGVAPWSWYYGRQIWSGDLLEKVQKQ